MVKSLCPQNPPLVLHQGFQVVVQEEVGAYSGRDWTQAKASSNDDRELSKAGACTLKQIFVLLSRAANQMSFAGNYFQFFDLIREGAVPMRARSKPSRGKDTSNRHIEVVGDDVGE